MGKRQFAGILKAELVKALGCTEPIAIAYASTVAREYLGAMPDSMKISCSGNIIKNAKAVVVPMTQGMRGIEAAAVTGAVGGSSERGLEVLTTVTKQDLELAKTYLDQKLCEVEALDTPEKLHVIADLRCGANEVIVELMRTHLGIVKIEKNGTVVYTAKPAEESGEIDYSCLDMDSIFEYAMHSDLSGIKELLKEQIRCNTEIAEAGLTGQYGTQVGKTLLEVYGNDVKIRAKAMPAAGSDARMNGCELPVVINSGSGNQGMTVSLPVIEYAKALGSGEEELYRALALSNLIAIYLKYQIGRLSAYCGVVTAAAGAGAGITCLLGGNQKQIEQTITNTLGNISGIVCDGASSSCAAKIASSVDAAVMAAYLSMKGRTFLSGEGIVKDELRKTVNGVITLAKEGMKVTDEVILDIMIHD